MPSPAEDEPTAAPEVGDVRPTPVDVASAQRRPSFWNAYRHALAGAHIRSGLLAGQVWAFGAAMVPLGVLLLVRNHDSLAFRSVVLGAMTLTTGLGAPVTARWVARAGGRRPLTFLGCANALALAALVGSVQLDAPARARGARRRRRTLRPPIISALRTLLTEASADGAARRTSLSLLSLLQEVSMLPAGSRIDPQRWVNIFLTCHLAVNIPPGGSLVCLTPSHLLKHSVRTSCLTRSATRCLTSMSDVMEMQRRATAR